MQRTLDQFVYKRNIRPHWAQKVSRWLRVEAGKRKRRPVNIRKQGVKRDKAMRNNNGYRAKIVAHTGLGSCAYKAYSCA